MKRRIVDSTLYTTSSFLRTMELLLGLPAMTQYDAAAMPLYSSFRLTPDLKGYSAILPKIDSKEKNSPNAWGAAASLKMDFDDVDRAPIFALTIEGQLPALNTSTWYISPRDKNLPC